MSGEEIRGRLFLTSGACRRGTVPEAGIHDPGLSGLSRLGQGRQDGRVRLSRPCLSRAGRGRRARPDRPRELRPERTERPRTPKSSRLSMEAAAEAGAPLVARLGDLGLFDSLLEALALPNVWRRRLRARDRAGPQPLQPYSTDAARASSRSRACWRRWKAPTMPARRRWSRIFSRSPGSTRSAGAPRARSPTGSWNRPRCGPASRSPPTSAGRSEAYLAVSGDPDAAAERLRRLANDAGLDLGRALDAFERRNGFIAARGVPIEETVFSAAFVRDFDYYTGFVFEARDPAEARGEARPRRRPL